MYKEVYGDLIKLAFDKTFDVIVHGCNCFCTMGAGIAPQMAKAFECNLYESENALYRGNKDKLGNIEAEIRYIDNGTSFKQDPSYKKHRLYVVNAYTQYRYGKNHDNGDAKPLDYEALTLCLRKINYRYKGLHIGLPLIGCGLAGGDPDIVIPLIKKELKDCEVTVVHYKK